MKARSLVLALACAAQLAALCTPAAAQGLRNSPLLGGGARPSFRADDSKPRSADYIVAVVNSEPITNNEVRSRMVRFEQQLAQQGTPLPPRDELYRDGHREPQLRSQGRDKPAPSDRVYFTPLIKSLILTACGPSSAASLSR